MPVPKDSGRTSSRKEEPQLQFSNSKLPSQQPPKNANSRSSRNTGPTSQVPCRRASYYGKIEKAVKFAAAVLDQSVEHFAFSAGMGNSSTKVERMDMWQTTRLETAFHNTLLLYTAQYEIDATVRLDFQLFLKHLNVFRRLFTTIKQQHPNPHLVDLQYLNGKFENGKTRESVNLITEQLLEEFKHTLPLFVPTPKNLQKVNISSLPRKSKPVVSKSKPVLIKSKSKTTLTKCYLPTHDMTLRKKKKKDAMTLRKKMKKDEISPYKTREKGIREFQFLVSFRKLLEDKAGLTSPRDTWASCLDVDMPARVGESGEVEPECQRPFLTLMAAILSAKEK